MVDVARHAGVSHQTVSRVINNMPNIRPETRDRVLAAIEELGYRPNSAARALVTKRSRTIGVIATESGLFGPTSIHRSIEEASRQQGYFVGSVSLKSLDAQSLRAAIDHLLAQSVEGIVMIAALREAVELVHQQDPGVPLVVVEGDLSRARFAVGVDQYAGARLATQHLIDLGHRRIAHVTGPKGWTEAEERLKGWREAMTEAGLDADLCVAGDWSAAEGFRAGIELAQVKDLTAIFAANDQTALGVLRALHEAGRVVPDDISVVGFDDSPEAGFLIPPLTTVRQDFKEVGRRAIGVLHAAILGEPEDLDRLIEPELIERASTRPTHGRER